MSKNIIIKILKNINYYTKINFHIIINVKLILDFYNNRFFIKIFEYNIKINIIPWIKIYNFSFW